MIVANLENFCGHFGITWNCSFAKCLRKNLGNVIGILCDIKRSSVWYSSTNGVPNFLMLGIYHPKFFDILFGLFLELLHFSSRQLCSSYSTSTHV